MKQHKQYHEDRFERKAKAMDRKAFRQKREDQSYKYIVTDDEFDDTASTGVMPYNRNFKKGNQNGY